MGCHSIAFSFFNLTLHHLTFWKRNYLCSSTMATSSSTTRSSNTIMAFKCNGFAVIARAGRVSQDDVQKTVKVYDNAYMGVSVTGSEACFENLKDTLPSFCRDYLPNPNDMSDVALFVLGHINNAHAFDWYNENVTGRFLLVGNVPTHKPFGIYCIEREADGSYDYTIKQVGKIKCIGSGAARLREYVRTFRTNMTEDEAVIYACEGIREAVGRDWMCGDVIRVIMLYPRDNALRISSQIRCFAPDDPNRCDTTYQEMQGETNYYPEGDNAS